MCSSKFWLWQKIQKPDPKKSHDYYSLYFLKSGSASKMLSHQSSITKSHIQPPMSLPSLFSSSYLLNALRQNHVKADISRTLHHVLSEEWEATQTQRSCPINIPLSMILLHFATVMYLSYLYRAAHSPAYTLLADTCFPSCFITIF